MICAYTVEKYTSQRLFPYTTYDPLGESDTERYNSLRGFTGKAMTRNDKEKKERYDRENG